MPRSLILSPHQTILYGPTAHNWSLLTIYKKNKIDLYLPKSRRLIKHCKQSVTRRQCQSGHCFLHPRKLKTSWRDKSTPFAFFTDWRGYSTMFVNASDWSWIYMIIFLNHEQLILFVRHSYWAYYKLWHTHDSSISWIMNNSIGLALLETKVCCYS